MGAGGGGDAPAAKDEAGAARRAQGDRRAQGERGERGRGGGRRGERQAVWKLEDGKPKMVLIRPGLSDGAATQMIEGELKPADLLITEIRGLEAKVDPRRRTSAF